MTKRGAKREKATAKARSQRCGRSGINIAKSRDSHLNYVQVIAVGSPVQWKVSVFVRGVDVELPIFNQLLGLSHEPVGTALVKAFIHLHGGQVRGPPQTQVCRENREHQREVAQRSHLVPVSVWGLHRSAGPVLDLRLIISTGFVLAGIGRRKRRRVLMHAGKDICMCTLGG